MDKNYKIMVVDDSEENREAVAELLRMKGFAVEEARNGREALDKLPGFRPHLFVLDVVMPQMNGLDLLEKLKIKESIHEAIIMTGYENLDDAKKAMAMGAFSYIGKPILADELYANVEKALSLVQIKTDRFNYLGELEEKVTMQTKELTDTLKILENKDIMADNIFNSLDAGILVVDDNDSVVFMNGKAQEILGLTFFDTAGENIYKAIKNKPYRDKLAAIIKNEAAVATGHNHLELKNADTGGIFYYLVKLSGYRTAAGETTGRVIHITDETAKLNFELLQNSLLTIVSHELRTPLTIVLNYLSILKAQKEKRTINDEILSDMEDAARGLAYYVNNIVSIASLSGTLIDISKDTIHVEKMIKHQMENFHREIREKNVGVTVVNNLPGPSITGDAKLLGIAVNCLISNAVKFNKHGGKVTVSLYNKKEGEVIFLYIEVSDQGIGLSFEQQEAIFNRFLQIEDHMKRRYHGIGAGLFLVKRAMEILKGSVQVSSQKGQGSVFTLKIPLEPYAP